MADKPSYTLSYDIVREIKTADGEIREEMIRPAGTSFTLRRSKGRHMEAMAAIESDIEKAFYSIAQGTGLTIDEVRDMDSFDIKNCGEAIRNFTKAGRGT